MRAFRFPLFRLGLLLAIGAAAYAAVKFYVGLGMSYADMAGPTPATENQTATRAFLREFFFGGAVTSLLFWGGVALMVLGAVRFAGAIGRGVSAPRASGGRAGRAPSSSSARSRGRGSPRG